VGSDKLRLLKLVKNMGKGGAVSGKLGAGRRLQLNPNTPPPARGYSTLHPAHHAQHQVRKGMMRARGEYLLMADADGATSAADVHNVLAKVRGLVRAQPLSLHSLSLSHTHTHTHTDS
jgi:hypothetical protein